MKLSDISTDKSYHKIYISLFIGLSFLMTGCAYLTWMYRLLDFYDAYRVDLYTEVLGYALQSAGLCLFMLFLRRCRRRDLFLTLIGIILITAINFALTNPFAILMSGLCMNVLIGVVAAYYLLALTSEGCEGMTGVVFGFGYAIGSIGTYLISIIGRTNLLITPYIIGVYVLMSALILFLYPYTKLPAERLKILPFKDFPYLAALTVFTISIVKGLGFFFPTSDVSSGSVSLELTRLFYAVGLIIAGFIIDKNRTDGAILCIIALVCPFLLYALSSNNAAGTLLWCLGYLFSGFFIIYRTVAFTDISSARNISILSCGSLLFGRLGDAGGSYLGMSLYDYPSVLMILSLVAFTAAVLLLISFEQRLNTRKPTDFWDLYDFTSREREVCKLAIAGSSNKEIAAELFITENTVKYHIKNILKKTDCKNRIELTKKAAG